MEFNCKLRRLARFGLALAMLGVGVSAQAWSPVFLQGSSFESFSLSPGQSVATANVLGWAVLPRVTGSTMMTGVFYPAASVYNYSAQRPFGTLNAAPVGALGPHAMYLNQPMANEGMAHALPSLAGGKIYRVSVALGSRLSEPAQRFSGVQIAIVNSAGLVLASTSVKSLAIRGVFQDVSFDADLGSGGCSNCTLLVRSLGQVRSGSYLDFDNVRMDALAGVAEADASGLTVDQPMAQQVVQRKQLAGASNYTVSVPVLGHAWGAARVAGAQVTASLLNTDGSAVAGVAANQAMAFDAATGLFGGALVGSVPKGGNYKVTIALTPPAAPTRLRSVSNVGIGDVFIVAGQSNSAAFGYWGTTQYTASNTQARVGDVTGGAWAPLLADPMPSISGFFTWGPGYGSAWPRFGELASQRSGVPIGVIAVGWGGTTASQWLPGADLHEYNLGHALRFVEPGGLRAIIWHQGESDVAGNLSFADYRAQMTSVIQGLRRKAGAEVPWYVAEVSAITNYPMGPRGAIAAAQRQLTRDLVGVYPGASTDYIVDRGMTHDGVHFNATGLDLHARMWADILSPGAPTAPVFNNAEFADVTLAPGQIAFGNVSAPGPSPTDFAMLGGWYVTNGGDTGFADSGFIGTFAPTTGFYLTDHLDSSGRSVPVGAADGFIAFSYLAPTGTAFYQSASLTGRPGASYVLTVRLGRRLGQDAAFSTARIVLSMGGRPVATRTVAVAQLSNGQGAFTPLTLNYTVPASAASGQKFAVRVEMVDAPANGYLDLDGASLVELAAR